VLKVHDKFLNLTLLHTELEKEVVCAAIIKTVLLQERKGKFGVDFASLSC